MPLEKLDIKLSPTHLIVQNKLLANYKENSKKYIYFVPSHFGLK